MLYSEHFNELDSNALQTVNGGEFWTGVSLIGSAVLLSAAVIVAAPVAAGTVAGAIAGAAVLAIGLCVAVGIAEMFGENL